MKIFAKNIKHLTDARYFAAWQVSWMCYALGSLSLSEINAIKAWVEGPKHILNVIGLDPAEAVAMLSTGIVDGYYTDNLVDHERIQSMMSSPIEAFVELKSELHSYSNYTPVFSVSSDQTGSFHSSICDIQGNPESIKNFIIREKPLGLILEGSEEEEVGLKSFDQLDEILEMLEEVVS